MKLIHLLLTAGLALFLAATLLMAGCGGSNPVNSQPSWRWSPLGGGLPGEVTAIAEYGGELYAAGRFAYKDNLRVFRGGSWVKFGDTIYSYDIEPVMGLAVYNGRLIVTGGFDSIGHVSTTNIAAWDGATWSALGAGLPSEMTGGRMMEFNGQLFVGSMGLGSMYLMAWNGSVWSVVHTGGLGLIRDMCLFNGELAATGDSLVDMGSYWNTYPWVRCWTGSAWHSITGNGGNNLALAVFNDSLYRILSYDQSIWVWSGTAWLKRSAAVFEDDDHGAWPTSLGTFRGELVVSGDFDRIDSTTVANIARWDGSAFTPITTGLTGGYDPRVRCQIVIGERMIVGGQFTHAGGITAQNIAEWSYR